MNSVPQLHPAQRHGDDHSDAPVLTETAGLDSMGNEEDGNLRPGPPPIVHLAMGGGVDVGDEAIDSMFAGVEDPLPEDAAAPTVLRFEAKPLAAKAQDGMTRLPQGWSLKGDIESMCPVSIDCQVFGRVLMESDACVEILTAGKITGSVKGMKVVVRGEVEGEIEAAGGLVDIKDGAQISGKVAYSQIRMDGGAHQMELHYVPAGKAATAD